MKINLNDSCDYSGNSEFDVMQHKPIKVKIRMDKIREDTYYMSKFQITYVYETLVEEEVEIEASSFNNYQIKLETLQNKESALVNYSHSIF